jgi:homoserine kinase
VESFRRDAVRVLVPASSANLGPGFDTAGLALGVYDELVAMVTDDEGVLVEVSGEGSADVPRDETNLVVRAMAAGFTAMGVRPTGFVLRCGNVIPHGRGMGSSAAAIVGGIVLARAMVVDGRDRLTDADVLQVALTMERHPDNLAAALHGGFTIAWTDEDGRGDLVRLDVHEGVHPVVLVPPNEVATAKARAMLPATVPFADAAANLSRVALLVHALTGDPSRLMTATEDRLHQDARETAYPESVALVRRLRAAGVPAVISGAGPTVLAFAGPDLRESVAATAGGGWSLRAVDVASEGAREVPLPPLA